jgi:translation elongation factor EF-4
MKYPKLTEAILTVLIYLAPLSPIVFDFFKPINQGYAKAEYTKAAEVYYQTVLTLLVVSWVYLSNKIAKFLLK